MDGLTAYKTLSLPEGLQNICISLGEIFHDVPDKTLVVWIYKSKHEKGITFATTSFHPAASDVAKSGPVPFQTCALQLSLSEWWRATASHRSLLND